MAHLIDLDRVEEIIKYIFDDRALLGRALQAPEHVQDEITGKTIFQDDGNRVLAQFGQSVLETFLLGWLWETGGDREGVHNIKSQYSTGATLAQVAKNSDLAVCIRQSQRQQSLVPSPQTLKNAVTAVLAAV